MSGNERHDESSEDIPEREGDGVFFALLCGGIPVQPADDNALTMGQLKLDHDGTNKKTQSSGHDSKT